jgi:hypothetical protein
MMPKVGNGGMLPESLPSKRLMHVAVPRRRDPAPRVARRDARFEDRSPGDARHPQQDVLADGRRFVVLRRAEESPEIVVVFNWLTELRSLMAAGGTKRAR